MYILFDTFIVELLTLKKYLNRCNNVVTIYIHG